MLDLNEHLKNMAERIRQMLGANITLQLNLGRDGLWVDVDAAMLEKVVVNLITNARDAMAQSGAITIETSRVNISQDFFTGKVTQSEESQEALQRLNGNYARLVVRDTGIGMDAQTMANAFMPFFTTKEVGKGKGLGLSAVYGIIKHSDGGILMESELGKGSTFEVYLPEVGDPTDFRPTTY